MISFSFKEFTPDNLAISPFLQEFVPDDVIAI
jgi:hypothetical protein